MESILKNLTLFRLFIIIFFFILYTLNEKFINNAIKGHHILSILLFIFLIIHFIVVAWWGFSGDKNEMNYVNISYVDETEEDGDGDGEDKTVNKFYSLFSEYRSKNSLQNKGSWVIFGNEFIKVFYILLVFLHIFLSNYHANNLIKYKYLSFITGILEILIILLVLFYIIINVFLFQNLNLADIFFRIAQILIVLVITILVFYKITISKCIILMLLLILYNLLIPLIYSIYNPSCDYYNNETNKRFASCIEEETSPSVCNDLNNDKAECLKTCYYIDTTVNEDILEDTEKENLMRLRKCVPIDTKCDTINCSSFQPTNAFEECCKLSKSGCTQAKIDQGLEDSKSEIDKLKESNRTSDGRVGEYGIESGENQIIYEYSQRICSEDFRRQELKDEIYD